MTRVSFSGKEVSLSYIWQWYQETEKAINHYKIKVIDSLTSGARMPDIFLSMTKDEVIEHFVEQQGEDILEILVNSHPACKSAVGDFRGLLRLRHWLAHGRYWTPKLGRNYTPERVFDISKNLFDALPADFSGAIS